MNPAIFIGSALWSSGSWLMRKAVSSGILHAEKLDARVISVGNLQAGGTGKTPVVARIANEACERGLKTCILSRGYSSEWEIHGGVIEPGTQPVDPFLTGDEPALLQRLVPGAWIAVGANRVRQFKVAEKHLGSKFDLVILDDGFQHWKIAKDLEILVMTSSKPGEKFFRDWPTQVNACDLVVWTKGDSQPRIDGKPCVHVRYRVGGSSQGKPIWIVCGVGDPLSVAKTAKFSGFQVGRQIALADHAEFNRHDIDRWLREAAAAGCRIAVTGKDWVKWRALEVSETAP